MPMRSVTLLPLVAILLKETVKYYISHAIAIFGIDPDTVPKSEENIESTCTESSNVTDQQSSSELLNSTSETKAVFVETLNSLDLFENYLKSRSEETAKPLKLLFDRGKSAHNELLTPDKIDNFLDILRSFLINKCSHDDKESESFLDCDQESSNSGNGELGNDVHLNSKPTNIWEEASKLDLVNEKLSPLSPNLKGNQKNFEIPQASNHNNVGNAPTEFENDLVKKDFDKIPTQRKDFVSSDEDSSIGQLRNKDKRNEKLGRKISKDSDMVYSVFPEFNKEKQSKGIDGYLKYSRTEKKKKSEKTLEEKALKLKNSFQFAKSPAMMISLRVKDLEDENLSLKSQMKSLQAKNQDILAELGQIAVQKTAKENEERRSELFQEIFRPPSSEATTLPTNKHRPINDMNGSLKRFLKSQTTNENADKPSVIYPANSTEQHVEGAEALVQRSNHQPGRDVMLTNVSEIHKDRNENQTPLTQNTSSNTAREKTSGREGKYQSEQFQETRALASISRKGYENLSLSVQQDDSGTECISLGNVPPTSVATTLYNRYKLMLLSLGQRLLSCDVVKLKNWASQNFSINNPQNATDILLQLDQKAVINASDLSQLSRFFESIVRIDLVHIIDAFHLGDYSLLRQNKPPKQQAANAARTSQYRSTPMYQSMFNAMNTGRQALANPAASDTLQTSPGRKVVTLRKPGNGNVIQRSFPQQTQLTAFRNSSDTVNPTHFSRSPNDNQSTASEQQNLQPATTAVSPNRMAHMVVADSSSVTSERRTIAGNSLTITNPSATSNPRNSQAVGSNGSKHSKFQRPETERSNISNFQPPGGFRTQYPDREDNWLCSHYKRHCYVKFECCNNFWPCHRCHNNQSTCGRKKLKSRYTKMLKCVYCNKVQQFGSSCCDCGATFSEYYCGLCKHLTGKDDNPYHCEKCGICRIHGDRSFHCDVCGVCLDVQLRGNHKCREDSAHDECCICLEDAFTGCQILPCSHKVHKECATQMIRSGITRCPICRESFAHKLERRPLPNSRKRSGK
ncbi:RING finger and CHY zinc finger domain-containing 1-like [Paramuricea clavata]|uniref:RING finger and CHY zinc finger domain-containing 1-like n=1 Tax=Paramuricea clavata TaxID=317549 RepID=A0A6S7JCK5_PARCT|nr:RING finger and CHY zinc finger domain-containing 1-like [Paramuricea clavata]